MKKGLNSEIIIGKIKDKKKDFEDIGVKQLGLFGSYLRGEEKKDSDIDFLIEFDDVTLSKYSDALELLKSMFRKKVDLIIKESLRSEFDYVRDEAVYVEI